MQLFRILDVIKQTPSSQMSPEWRKRFETFDGNEEELIQLFKEFCDSDEFEASESMKQIIEPIVNTYIEED